MQNARSSAGHPPLLPKHCCLCVGCALLCELLGACMRCARNSIICGCPCGCHVSWQRPSTAALHRTNRAGSMGHQLLAKQAASLAKQAANKPKVRPLQPWGRRRTYMGLVRLFDPPGCLPARPLRRRIKQLHNQNPLTTNQEYTSAQPAGPAGSPSGQTHHSSGAGTRHALLPPQPMPAHQIWHWLDVERAGDPPLLPELVNRSLAACKVAATTKPRDAAKGNGVQQEALQGSAQKQSNAGQKTRCKPQRFPALPVKAP